MANNNDPLFSIVIPTYNHGHLIQKCLDSVVAQTYPNWEAIVVNNFSTDNTEEVVASYRDKRIRLINFSNDGIIARSRNRAIGEAKGDWLCFLDSDDWWTADKLALCLPYTNDCDLIYHDLRIVSEKGNGRKLKIYQINTTRFIDDFFTKGNPIPNSSVVLRRTIQQKAGLLNDGRELIGVEDADFWLRVLKVTPKVCYLNRCLGYYWVGNNLSGSPKQLDRQKMLYDLYQSRISTAASRKARAFLTFSCARILHMNKDANAGKYYREVVKSGASISYSIKSVLGLLLLSVGK